MIRLELISNLSIQDDLTEALCEAIPGFQYSVIPQVFGKGGSNYKLGTPTWPETNFILISWVEDCYLETLKDVINTVKQRAPREGTRFFLQQVESL